MTDFQNALVLFRDTTPLRDFLPDSDTPKFSSKEQLVDFLLPYVQNLLDYKMDVLLKIMYRVDVDEQKFKYVLSNELPEKLGLKVTELLVDRQLQKVYFRTKYSGI